MARNHASSRKAHLDTGGMSNRASFPFSAKSERGEGFVSAAATLFGRPLRITATAQRERKQVTSMAMPAGSCQEETAPVPFTEATETKMNVRTMLQMNAMATPAKTQRARRLAVRL